MKKQDSGKVISFVESKRIVWYVFVGDDLYKRGFPTPLLKCVSFEEVEYMLNEVYNGVCGLHIGQRALKA